MKHTINNPLVLEWDVFKGLSINKHLQIGTTKKINQELVSKEVAEELAEALERLINAHESGIKQLIESFTKSAKETLKNTE